VSSSYSDLDRPPLREEALRRALVRPGSMWTSIDVIAEIGSTNTELGERAGNGAPHGAVLVAESQTAGRGRLGRGWIMPPRSGIAVSMLLRPGEPGADIPPEAWGWLPLLVGTAARSALAELSGLDVLLKWPNDLILREVETEGPHTSFEPPAAPEGGYGGRKLGGILAQRVDTGVVIGLGVNVTTRQNELPAPQATSLALAGAAATDREPLLRAVLRRVDETYQAWKAAGGDAARSGLRDDYMSHCATIGRAVRVTLPGDETVSGTATGVDEHGALLLVTDAKGRPDPAAPSVIVTITAGDVIHVR
jgi:BirA family biotin operon repressor/biotin-[acetyl-CoA-carboxylase] ligase